MILNVEAPHFSAAVVYNGQKAVRAAPIVAYALNMSLGRFEAYCRGKGWKTERLK